MFLRLLGYILLCITIVIMLLSVPPCDERDALANDKHEIQSVLSAFQSAFNYHNIDDLMLRFHDDYLHDGYVLWSIRERWLDVMAAYQELSIENITINVNGSLAVVSMRFRFETPEAIATFDAPAELGDLSYLVYENNRCSLRKQRCLFLRTTNLNNLYV